MIASTVCRMLWMRGEQRAPDQNAAEHADDRQNGDRAGEPVPEAPLQRREARNVAAHEQIVSARQYRAHEHALGGLAAQIHRDRGQSPGLPARRAGQAGKLPASGRKDASVSSRMRSPAICRPTRVVDECLQAVAGRRGETLPQSRCASACRSSIRPSWIVTCQANHSGAANRMSAAIPNAT